MARFDQDREDLMREATALTRRVELQLPGHSESCIVGFRPHGEASIFMGGDPVFQFNAAGQLRRGYWRDCLVKAEGGRLVQLERHRTDREVQLVRRELTSSKTTEFLELAAEILDQLRHGLDAGDLVILKQVPVDLDVVDALVIWLDSLPRPLTIAVAPNVSI